MPDDISLTLWSPGGPGWLRGVAAVGTGAQHRGLEAP
jgi:hypothetical protein